MWSLMFVTILALGSVISKTINLPNNDTEWRYSFEIDYENNQFLLDGKPFRYVSGSFHYFRAPRQYWRDRLRKIRAAGLNAVSTYVEWSLHEPEPGHFNWAGDADLVNFLNIAQEEDLLVLLRPGPYICAERDLGGLPYWLLREVPNIKLRTKDTDFVRYATVYLNQVLEKVKPLLRGNGGPIIMVQIENEYGSYYACDTEYMDMLRNIFIDKIGDKALLYTTDGASASLLRCGFIPGVYITVDFGTSTNVTNNFQSMRLYQPRGPLVNSEFYPGWLTHWGETFQRVKTETVIKTLKEMLAVGASVNFYMFYGGTNFGFTSGANGGTDVYNPQLTSYDYDAPLTEAGDPTDKYFAIRDVIGRYLPLPNMSLPTASPKGNYGPVLLEPVLKLFDSRSPFLVIQATGDQPKSFEALSVNQGFVLYETNLPPFISDPAILRATTKDRALIYVDNRLCGILSRINKIFTIPLEIPYGRHLSLLVENQGRLNFGNEIRDFKGISSVTISDTPLTNWNMTGYAFSDVSSLRNMATIRIESGTLNNGPVFLRGQFTIVGQPLDTFLDTTGWGKGVAFVNGHNLGRYWPLVGPQITLYIPAPYLRAGENELIILELEYVLQTRKMKFQSVPNLGEKPHGCAICGKMFSTSSSLNTHVRIHTGERPHECPMCGKRFTASSNLYYHRMTHYKEKPHKCDECGRSFPTPGDLRAHGYSHTGNWPLRCPVCNRGFCKFGALHHHMKSHGDSYYGIYNQKSPVINNLQIHEHLQHSHVSNNNTADYTGIHNGISSLEIIKFEDFSNNYMQLPTMFPWPSLSWMPLQFPN